MSKALITESHLTAIADAIRAKNLSSDQYTPAQMAAAIQAIPTSVEIETLSVAQNGTYTAPSGKAYNPVAVNVVPNLQSKTATQNGTVTPDQGYDGLSEVTVDVGEGDAATIYAIGGFTPNTNADTQKTGGWQFSSYYNLQIAGVRFWARTSLCNVYIKYTDGNTIMSLVNAVATPGQWNDILFPTPVTLNRNTSYLIFGSNQNNVSMRYSNSYPAPQFVTVEAVKYSTTPDFPPNIVDTTGAMYGIDLIVAIRF